MFHGRFIQMAAIASILTLSAAGAVASDIRAVPGEFLVKVKSNAKFSAAALKQMTNAESLRIVSRDARVMLVKTNMLVNPEYSLAELKKNSNFAIVEPNYIYQVVRMPNDPQLGDLWGLLNTGKLNGRAGVDIGAEPAWDIQTGSDKVVVAVIDTGLDYTHPDIKPNAWVNVAELNGRPGVDDDGNGYVDDIYGYDFVNDDADPMDDHGHGTHCAGTIGARGDDGIGVVGVAWNVKLMGLKFLSADGSGTLEAAVKAIDYATAKGVDIMSNSWGGGGYSQILSEAIENARKKGILFIAAAGNGDAQGNGIDNDLVPAYPATYPHDNVISVAAIDRTGKLAKFSNYGKNTVHLAAPGVQVTSSVPGGYKTWNGTSMATPHVSGVAALLKSQFPTMKYNEIKKRLMATARPLGTLRNRVATMGVVNAFYALTNQEPPLDPDDAYYWASVKESHSTAHPYAANTQQTFTIHRPGASRLAVYFQKFQTETGYDIVRFKDAAGNTVGEWSGVHHDEFSPPVNGDTLIIEFIADNTEQRYGFDITKVAYE